MITALLGRTQRNSRWVTEYQAEVLVDEHGQRFVAEFPAGVTRPIQYGPNLKTDTVYLSQTNGNLIR